MRLGDFVWPHAYHDQLDVLPEVAQLPQVELLCLYGLDERESICRQIDSPKATVVGLPGGHHFGGDYDRVAQIILDKANGVPME